MFRWPCIGCAAAIALLAASASGQPAGARDPQAVREATALFTKGSEFYRKKSYGDALAALQSSHALVPSPNSALFIARCLRELGQSVEAAAEFEEVEHEAAAEATASDGHYEETAKAAASEGAELRAGLGKVNVRVLHLPAGGQILVDGAPVTLKGDGYTAYHAPGAVTVTLRAPPASNLVKSELLRAGDHVDVDLDPAATAPPPRTRPGWMVPVIAAAGGVGAVGIAMSIGFGASSRATFNQLQSTCGSMCTSPAQQDDIASGKRNQTISNVSLAFGLAGAGIAGAVGIALWRGGPKDATTSLDVGPGRVTLVGRF